MLMYDVVQVSNQRIYVVYSLPLSGWIQVVDADATVDTRMPFAHMSAPLWLDL